MIVVAVVISWPNLNHLFSDLSENSWLKTTNKQANYLIPESVDVGKGSNLIVSLFHHYLENFSSGEKTMYTHADNCGGQNKNKFW